MPMPLEYPIFELKNGKKVVNLSEHAVVLLSSKLTPGANYPIHTTLHGCDNRLAPYIFMHEESYFDRNSMERVTETEPRVRFPVRTQDLCKSPDMDIVILPYSILRLVLEDTTEYPWWTKMVEPKKSFIPVSEERAVRPAFDYVIID